MLHTALVIPRTRWKGTGNGARLGDETRQTLENSVPFIGPAVPFVERRTPVSAVFIGHNIPFVGIQRILGFSLIELIAALVIASILLTIAVPSFQTFVRSNQVSSQINGLVADLTLARTEAVKRMTVVTVCNSNDQQGCTDTSWSDGWIVWADADVDGVVDSSEILRAAPAIITGASLTSATFADLNRLQYQPSGSPDSIGTFELCDAENRFCRCLTIGTTGDAGISDGTCP